MDVALHPRAPARLQKIGRALSPNAVVEGPVWRLAWARRRSRQMERDRASLDRSPQVLVIQDIGGRRFDADPARGFDIRFAARNRAHAMPMLTQALDDVPADDAGGPDNRDPHHPPNRQPGWSAARVSFIQCSFSAAKWRLTTASSALSMSAGLS